MKKTNRTDNQVEVIPFRYIDGILKVLILLRTEERGGFWQPVTGNVEKGEVPIDAALRELEEETSMEAVSIVGPVHEFDFFDDGREQHEVVFGAKIAKGEKIKLSREHEDYRWVEPDEAITSYLKWPGNISGVMKLVKYLQEMKQ